MQEPYACRTHVEMKDVLMNPKAAGPAIHYYMIRGGVDKTNITVIEAGKVGDEYIKTFGHYHVFDFKETYHILQGEGLLLIQERAKDSSGTDGVAGKPIDDTITKFQAIKVSAGKTIAIPPFAGHLLVNTGKTWLVTSDDSIFAADSGASAGRDSASMPTHADYEAVRKMRGFAYYVIEKDGKPTLVKNPTYKSVPQAVIK